MDAHIGGYRDAAPPPSVRFPLRVGPRIRNGVLFCGAVFALVNAALVLVGLTPLTVIVTLAAGVLLFRWGIPCAVDVRRDVVALEWWLRPARVLSVDVLSVQVVDGELLLVTPTKTLAVATEHFPDESLTQCIDALRVNGVPVLIRP